MNTPLLARIERQRARLAGSLQKRAGICLAQSSAMLHRAAGRWALLASAARRIAAQHRRSRRRSASAFVRFARRLTRRPKRPRPRASLINHLLTLQLAIIAAVGLLALGGLYWTSRTVIDENLTHWAKQWVHELNELGTPFYLSNTSAAVVDVERFAEKYPEIERVSWYGPDGRPMASLNHEQQRRPLDSATVTRLAALVGSSSPYLLTEKDGSPLQFRLAGPIWSETTAASSLLGLGSGAPVQTQRRLLGFVAVDLDYSWYHSQFLPKLWIASLALLALLGMSWIAGRILIKRALSPLAQLQAPLAHLASGDMQVHFPRSEHTEIHRIVSALEETTVALQERDKRLVHLAMHDSLTGLYNRHRFVSELEEEIAAIADSGHHSAVLFVDLDQFKYVNDTCGHPAGDELLKLAARCIGSAVRSTDIVARFGGDEFAVLLKHVSRHQARSVGLKILEQMRALTHVQDDKVFTLQCSIGVAEIGNRHTDPHELLSQADLACHVAKLRGRNRLEFYKVAAREGRQMTRDIDWVRSTREALEQDRFELHYQPLLHVRTGVVNHYESLLRLRLPNGHIVAPSVFLPAAARFGLLPDIDRWVVDRALKTLAELRPARGDLRFSINLSASVFDEGEFIAYVRLKLNEYGLPGDSVIFELTEQEAIRFAFQAAKQMSALRDLGCQFAIDDFGTGYSSFAYLKRLPVDFLKIDGSFIRGLERDPIDQTMVRLIGEVAKAANIKTVAEYVQSGAAMNLLAKYRIDYAQGFYIGRPSAHPEEKTHAVPLPGPGALRGPRSR
ncbi:MAG TPA: EAL domain-containing protein [Gammaproteobacteria bacterium]|nr:EAL domain-containing protein [Gammaproteobacteria bacterium]